MQNKPSKSPIIFCTFHPAAVLHGGGQYEPSILEDLARPRQSSLQLPATGRPIGTRVGFDSEYYFSPTKPVKPVVITTAVATSETIKVYDKEGVKKIRWLLDKAKILCGHAIEHDLDCLTVLGEAREDWLRGENILDSLLLARMENENKVGKGEYKLETLFLQNFKTESWKADTEMYGNDPRKWPEQERKRRCGLDAWATYLLCRKFYTNARGPIVFNHSVAQTLHRIYLAGAVVKLSTWKNLKGKYTRETNTLRERITRIAHAQGMKEFQPTNDNHIRELVYRRLRCPILNRTEKTNLPAVDKITLGQLQDRKGIKELLAFSKADKILNTYLLSLPELWSPLDSSKALLRFRLIPLGARTTRRASADPNSQNWPPAVMGMIVSRFKGGKILSIDYNKLEPLLMSWEAGDEKMFDFFYNGKGYIDIARELWGKTVTEDSTEYRTAKSISLGVNYDLQSPNMAKKLYLELGIRFAKRWDDHVRITDKYRRKYLDMFLGLRSYIKAREEELLDKQGVCVATGAFRHLPCLQGRNTEGFWHLRKEAINSPIQGLAAAVTGSAMIDCEAALLKEYDLSYVDYQTALLNSPKENLCMPLLINEVHDALVYDVPGDQIEKAKEIIVETMGNVPTLRRLVPDLKFKLKMKTTISNQWRK